METLVVGDALIVYEDRGGGPAVLCLAPGGLSASRGEVWARSPWNPLERLAGDYRLVVMDQRNTGTSWAPVTARDGWGSYAADQLAVMDHLGIDTFAVVGMCIGGAFIARLLADVPARVTAAVAMQPIGLDDNRDVFLRLFDEWRAGIAGDHPEAGEEAWTSFRQALFGDDRLVWSVEDKALPGFDRPLLVLEGDDDYHPRSVSRRLADMVPAATLVERWKQADDVAAADAVIRGFLSEHAR
ncbi:MAG: alpha/beta fold hydrolase [Acidimicrobiales bacterium]